MPCQYTNDLGTINIADNVIAKIAGLSAMESYGIVGMSAIDAKDGFYNLLNMENLSKGVKVSTDGQHVDISLYVVLEFGVKISVVCDNIIEKVKYNVEKQTAMSVKNVNVFVQGLRMNDKK
ncbi:MAG: Asp23/Gls24 family envelope stress response protein [Fenollaria massiliensis]|jgi:uncharacterized alkaline shock family protein YloU|uniref:Asp23/Gls24 family envelope stress response protein n=1 Tax=Fenollaria massiliensis TaxID=938288 RepID=A0A9E7DKL6_9FIRM|nr:Asp23/Gls24 family envelope stress response protein [Fenollaria massiliensis]AVM66693.1 Asp23/Gls24 family envelope stress response protein [Peptostreptococcaceae bacterium oral taxon 929]UQK59645.1 Asp23/Gls24 family envelope stress response protein [Fenollaria massiliensis]